ncbi:isoleucine--tRNA ligase [Armatimonas rosea]|uniref:Isoleucine--tRNA ligase n=1 Tax=Armatimonas rosea TaxID=685828 RepID=A0A7W9SSQ9_ARMRO|nr:isoleucine--tRNA ligase [Armatimonas rosea]MBB6052151.1 isoleucyl-tRNA synthetase [Armatimonas rosea]
MDYSKTLNLPQTEFPMRADLPSREPLFQARWKSLDLYQKSLDKPAPKGQFLLHDGPPYSNGNIHLGHALNKTLKDIVTRYKTMAGYQSPYVPGWDNHGLPIEVQVMKEFREKKESWTPDTLRARCRTYAAEWVATQKTQFQRLGIRGDWDNPYLTMAPAFEAKIVETFLEMARKGYVYRGLKPVLWDSANETALANTEAEYKDHVSPAIYVGFESLAEPGLRAVIWTTTPWTIPANLALAFHPDFDYVVVETENAGKLVLLGELLEATATACNLGAVTVLETRKGASFEGARFRHPLPELDRDSVGVLATYVTTDTGTGIVHTAPGHGADDYVTGMKYGLPVLSPVDGRGRYTDEAGPFVGLSTDEANKAIPERLAEVGALLGSYNFTHSYPHSPRAPYKPLLFRATVQWFVSVEHDGLRQKALDGIKNVAWYPAQAENRITAAVAGRPDWTVSRQRHWGVPIALFYANGEAVMDEVAFDAAVAVIRKDGVEGWYNTAPEAILPEGFTYNGVAAKDFEKEKDVLDVWFDSGSTSFAVLDSGVWPGLRWPADLYLEGSDQHRGWFNSSLMIASALRGTPPYKAVVTNGFTVDERGIKMSKSKGNTVDPLGVIDELGADVLRLWVGSIDFTEDTRLGKGILEQLADSYRKLRNTLRFLLGNLADFNPDTDRVAADALDPLDAWILSKLSGVVTDVTAAYDEYAFYKATQALIGFCNTELSGFYLDVLKDRLYTLLPEDPKRRSSQTAMLEVATALITMLAPVLVHTADEAWEFLPSWEGKAESVHLADWPTPGTAEAALEARFEAILAVRDAFNLKLEPFREALAAARKAKESTEGLISKSTEAHAEVTLDANLAALLAGDDALVAECLMVAKLTLTSGDALSVTVSPAPGKKCMRSWFIREDVGSDPEFPEISAPQAAIVRELVRRGTITPDGTV